MSRIGESMIPLDLKEGELDRILKWYHDLSLMFGSFPQAEDKALYIKLKREREQWRIFSNVEAIQRQVSMFDKKGQNG